MIKINRSQLHFSLTAGIKTYKTVLQSLFIKKVLFGMAQEVVLFVNGLNGEKQFQIKPAFDLCLYRKSSLFLYNRVIDSSSFRGSNQQLKEI